MLTAHQRILIARQLPEVEEANDLLVRAEELRFPTIHLQLSDGSDIAIIEQRGETRGYRSRLADDYSDRATVLPIDADMRERLIWVFGAMTFRDPK